MQLVSASPALLGALVALALSSGSVPAQVPLQSMIALTPSVRTEAVALEHPEARAESVPVAPLVYLDQRLESMMEELVRSSPTAASMLATVRELGYPLVIGTFHDLAAEMQEEYRAWTRSPRSAAGYMAPVVRPGAAFSGELLTVKINLAVNLELLDELFAGAPQAVPEAGVDWAEIQRLETLAVLAHELVHAHGLAVAGGDPRHGCHDPGEEDLAEASCVMIGENQIRSEIGAPLDWDYGFPAAQSLADRYRAQELRRRTLLEIAAFRLPKSGEWIRPHPRTLPD